MTYHFYSEFEPKDAAAKHRQTVAKMSWSIQPWTELPIRDQDLPRLWHEEGRSYPYLLDLFDAAVSKKDDADILIFTNSDIGVVTKATFYIALALQDTDACYCYRRDFNHDYSEPIPDDVVPRGDDYVGSDLYAFRTFWWRKVRGDFPDMLLGHELGDAILRRLIDSTNFGKPTMLRNLIYHRRHASWWEKAENRYRLNGQIHNLTQGANWLRQKGVNPSVHGVKGF